MEETLREKLVSGGVDETTVAILEDQKLTDCLILNEVDMNVLLLCGVKAGDAMQVKKICKVYASTKDNEGETCLTESPIQVTKEIPRKDVLNECTLSSELDGIDKCSKRTFQSPFLYEEKQTRMFFKGFKLLDKFSPAVSYALEHDSLTGPQRSEFVRDICTNISSNGIYFLNKEQRNKVALAIVTRYPHLKDSIGSGLGSWSESIKNRFKHMRKYENKKRKLSADSEDSGNTTTTLVGLATPNTGRPKKMDFWNVVPICVGTTNGIQNDHIAELHKECQKPSAIQDKIKIRELMNSTYELRRRDILTTTVPVIEIIQKYPPLANVNGIRHEFCRVMEDDHATKDIKDKFSTYQSAIIKYCEGQQRKTPFIKNSMRCLHEAISEDADNIQTLENTCAVMVLPKLLERKSSKNGGNELIQILCEDDDLYQEVRNTTFPRLVGIGENILNLDRILLCVEGEELADVSSFPMDTIFFCLHACYYIFSIVYPQEYKDLFFFIDSVLLSLHHTATNRISLQKFIKALDSLV